MSEKPFTLAEYSKKILTPSIEIIYGYIKTWPEIPPAPPPTRMQKLKWKWYDYQQRAKDIWTILRGKDIHEDCRDY